MPRCKKCGKWLWPFSSQSVEIPSPDGRDMITVCANCRDQAEVPETAVVLICEVPSSVRNLDPASLKLLIHKVMGRRGDDPSLYTLIRYIAGDVHHDVSQRYGQSGGFKLTLLKEDDQIRHAEFKWQYPSSRVDNQITNYALGQWNDWCQKYISALARARQ